MTLIQNIPLVSLVSSMVCAVVSSVLDGKKARRLNLILLSVLTVLSLILFTDVVRSGEYFIFKMGKFPAPWGNEIRIGILEAGMALVFCVIALLSMIGGRKYFMEEIEEYRQNLYYVMVNLLFSSLLALVYTNDLFTAYVFIEINTISACGMIMIRKKGVAIAAAAKYMIMSLLGSGMVLFGICILYDITGHLLMSNIQLAVMELAAYGEYHVPLMFSIILITTGLGIKSALFPFHSWLPGAYGNSTVSTAMILSSLVSKAYIFLLIKFYYRVIGIGVVQDSGVLNVLFVLGVTAMILGSLNAMKEKNIRKMIAYSSVAQIGYIYMGIGLGSSLGFGAAIFHMISHAACKSMLFLSGEGLAETKGGTGWISDLTGAAYQHVSAGVGFLFGSMSMVGIPVLGGFASKLLFVQAGIADRKRMIVVVVALGISTILNAMYFMKTCIILYTPSGENGGKKIKNNTITIVVAVFVLINVTIGVAISPISDWIQSGLQLFS